MGVVLTTEVGNCRLLQTVCVPMMGVMDAGVEVAYPEPAGPWLGEETVGFTDGPGCDMLLLESTVGALVICHKFEPSGMRAYARSTGSDGMLIWSIVTPPISRRTFALMRVPENIEGKSTR